MSPPTHSIYWDLPILIVIVSLVYSATRFETWPAILHEAFRWGLRMTTFLGGIGLALYIIGWWLDSGYGWWVLAVIAGAAVLLFVASFVFSAKKDRAVT
jgi:hypothetical protein